MIHTETPWEIQKGTNTYIVAKGEHGDSTAIALVFPQGIAGCETSGNAQLMKLAPRMFELLAHPSGGIHKTDNPKMVWIRFLEDEYNQILAEVGGKQ